ncbi:MAG: hypothetical protein FWG78_03525 [Coriobacteriia bacterium]|nr:hypothetical protein [Coriobacteriia bacterium]
MDFVNAIKRICARDATLFSADEQTQAEISERLGWVNLPEKSIALLPLLDELAAEADARDIRDIVLLGMGGSSLAPLVFAQTGVTLPFEAATALMPTRTLHVLDTTCPDDVRAVDAAIDYAHTLFIVSSKSGTTIETTALESYFWTRAQAELGGADTAATHFIAITDPGTPLAERAGQRGYRTLLAPPDVGGRFSALSIFGLAPCALIGLDYRVLVAEAFTTQHMCQEAKNNPAATRALLIYEGWKNSGPFLPLADAPLALWIEQLIAESLGKEGRGIIPVATPVPQSCPNAAHEMIVWQWTVALLGVAMGINPFDQPDVASTKEATLATLSGTQRIDTTQLLSVDAALETLQPNDYVCVLAFVNEQEYAQLAETYIPELRARAGVPVLLQRGPRYLHSTGQLYKGGPNNGVFLVKSSDVHTEHTPDIELPDADYTLRELFNAQRDGDIVALLARGRRVALV